MKIQFTVLIILLGMFLFPNPIDAQVDFNKKPGDDLGNVEDAFQEFFFEALKQKGIENYERAVDALQECLKLDSTKPIIYFELGKNYNLLKNFEDAKIALIKASNSQPDNEWILDELYEVYTNLNDAENAIKTVKQLVKYHPDYKQDLATLFVREKRYNEALELLDELDNQLGISDSREAMRNDIYSITGSVEDRIEHLEQRILNDPNNEDNYLKLIYRYSQAGDAEKAYVTAQQLLSKKPNSVLVHLALYKFYLDKNKIDEAVNSMKIALQSPEINADAKAKVLKDFVGFVAVNQEYEKDLIEVTDLLDDNKSPETLSDLGLYYLKSGDKVKALNSFKEALKQDPNDFKLIKDILLLHLDLQDNNEALEGATEALQLYPAQPLLYLIIGVAYNNLKAPKKAIENLEIGLDYLIDNTAMEADFYMQLSIAYRLDNNINKANAFVKKAEALKDQ